MKYFLFTRVNTYQMVEMELALIVEVKNVILKIVSLP